ncbi:MAG: glycosyltransferase family 4 protein [Planctomycetota bacterium]
MSRTYRVAYLVSHPIQYQAPLLRRIAAGDEIDLTVTFLSDFSAREHAHPGFERRVAWDVPLLSGYRHQALSSAPSVSFLRPLALDLPARIAAGAYDALWVHGWSQLALLRAVCAASKAGVPVLLRGESVPGERAPARRAAARWLFRRVAACLPIGARNRAFYRENDVPEEQLFDAPYGVDNERFRAQAEAAAPNRAALRAELGLDAGRPVLLFASKLIERKRPGLLLDAYRRLSADGREPRPYLLFVGEGPQRVVLERRVRELGWGSVRFLGFRNQTELPALYDLCDAFVLPSAFETWGLVLNEAMNAGRPVIASDAVGAVPDLVLSGETGYVFPSGDAEALSQSLRRVLDDPEHARRLGEGARRAVEAYGLDAAHRGLLRALDFVCAREGRSAA